MTVKISKPALNLREKLSELENTVEYSQQQFWFDNLVTNGTFDTDISGWTGSGGSVTWDSTGQRIAVLRTSSLGVAYQGFTTEIGKTYTVSCDAERSGSASGNIAINSSTAVGGSYLASTGTTTGAKSLTFTATTTTSYFLIYETASNTLYVDNISVFEVDANGDAIHTLPVGWKPLHVYEDGALQREGSADDYTVVKTGDSYSVKPAVAPSATTETCVIAERKL